MNCICFTLNDIVKITELFFESLEEKSDIKHEAVGQIETDLAHSFFFVSEVRLILPSYPRPHKKCQYLAGY